MDIADETRSSGPHQGRPVLKSGAALSAANAAMIMIHGRGAGAADVLGLAEFFARPEIAYLAPEAAGGTWYPNSFLAPVERNEPGRSSGLGVIAALLGELAGAGLPAERVALLGFSQGACLALEFAARNPRRYGAVMGLSGGLIGATIDPADYSGSLAGTPVFIGCSDVDPHVPLARVRASAAIMRGLGGDVTERIYEGMGHTVNADEAAHVAKLLDGIAAPAG
jgi:predicted esterase